MCLFLRRIRIAGAAALFMMLAFVAAADSGAMAPSLRTPEDRTPAPDFSLADAGGSTITLSAFKGRVVLLDFWATWCTGCKVEIPWYIECQRKYARQGLTSIGAAMDEEGWEKVRPYLEAHPIGYPIVIGNPELVKPYQVTNMPVTLLIDREGMIADAHIGIVAKGMWEREILVLLKERSNGRRASGVWWRSLLGHRRNNK